MTLATRLILPLLLSTLPASGAGKRPFAIEDLYRLKGISSLALSPDGQRLLFQVSTPDLRRAKTETRVWVLDLGTGESRPLTQAGAHSPQWSRDGRTVCFLSSREGGSQLWALGLDGGEARKWTSFDPGIGSPKLLPQPGRVVFQASVFLDGMADGSKHRALEEKLEKGPVQAHLADALLYRHWTEWREFRYSHLFAAGPDGKVEALTSGA